MSNGSIVFVHGTGVRLRGFVHTYEISERVAAACGLRQAFVPCAWGDPLGIEFDGESLPDPPSAAKLAKREQEFAEWNWLFDDPLFELTTLTIRDPERTANTLDRPDKASDWEILWKTIDAYEPSPELSLLLERGGLSDLWKSAWDHIVLGSNIPKQAFEASAHELPEACRALARSLIAQIHALATDVGRPGPSATLRSKLLDRLLIDWNQQVLGLSGLISSVVLSANFGLMASISNFLKSNFSPLSVIGRASFIFQDLPISALHADLLRLPRCFSKPSIGCISLTRSKSAMPIGPAASLRPR